MMWGSHPQSPFGWLLNVNIEIYNGQLQSVQKLNSIKTGVFVKLPMGKNKTILLLNHLFVLHHFLHIFYINKPLQVLGKSPFFLGEFTRTAVFPCPGAAAASAAVPEKKGLDAAQATKRLMAIVGRLGGEKWGIFTPKWWLVGGLEHEWIMTFHSVGNVIIPTDSYFSEGFKPPTMVVVFDQKWGLKLGFTLEFVTAQKMLKGTFAKPKHFLR